MARRDKYHINYEKLLYDNALYSWVFNCIPNTLVRRGLIIQPSPVSLCGNILPFRGTLQHSNPILRFDIVYGSG